MFCRGSSGYVQSCEGSPGFAQACASGVDWGDCPKSQTFLSENRESAFGLVLGYGVFQSREDFSDSLGGSARIILWIPILRGTVSMSVEPFRCRLVLRMGVHVRVAEVRDAVVDG